MTTPTQHDVYILADPEFASALETSFERYQTTIYKSPRIPAFLALAKQAEGGTHTAALIDARFIQETELWAIVQQLTPAGLVIGVVGVQSLALRQQLASAGIMIIEHTEADTIADLIATAIGAANRSARSTVVIAIGGAKGGIGKSAVTARLAEGLAMRFQCSTVSRNC
jgi:Flp pilus assembly CpaE family ATPase